MNHIDQHKTLTDNQEDELLDDLELRCQTNVAAVRDSAQQRRRVLVRVEGADICDRGEPITVFHTSAMTADMVTGIASRPLMVGSVFHLSIDGDTRDATTTLAVCDRCAMFGDASFELRFRCTRPIDVNDG